MKYILILMIIMTSCSHTRNLVPKDVNQIDEDIAVTPDGGTVVTKNYVVPSDIGKTWASYRANYLFKHPIIHLHFSVMRGDWAYFYSATGEDGHKFKLTEIDRKTNPYGPSADVKEEFTLVLTLPYLLKMSKKDWRIKVYGKSKFGVIVVPKELSEAFYRRVNKKSIAK